MPHEREWQGAVGSNTIATDGQAPVSDKANQTKQNNNQNKQTTHKTESAHQLGETKRAVR